MTTIPASSFLQTGHGYTANFSFEKMIILSHPLGNANVRAAASAFRRANLLYRFYTSIALFEGSVLEHVASMGPFSELRRRSFDLSLRPFTRTFPWTEAGRQLAGKAGLSKLTRHEDGIFSVDAVFRNMDRHVKSRIQKTLPYASAVYAYEDGALSTFAEAKKLGLSCLYDLPIGYWRASRRLLAAEQDRWPEWAATLETFRDSEEKLERKDEELRLADRIYVASTFTARTLEDFPGKPAPVEIIPYGFPPVVEKRMYSAVQGKRKLRLLFVGSLSQRKGIADVFSVAKAFGSYAELTIIGHKPCNDCAVLNEELSRHTWIPELPHHKILEVMREHDVLLFPSLFEGFGLVITEAMSQGTPVITTERTAGPDLITHGANGWIINAGSTEALKEVIEDILLHPGCLEENGRRAMNTAANRPWEVYQAELAASVEKNITHTNLTRSTYEY